MWEYVKEGWGLRIEPCRTPQVIFTVDDDELPIVMEKVLKEMLRKCTAEHAVSVKATQCLRRSIKIA